MSARGRWDVMLDELAAHLAAQRDSLAAGHPEELAAYLPPPGLGPLPSQLRPRLDQLRAESNAIGAEVTRLRDELGRRLAALPRRHRTEARPSGGCYIDVNA